VDARTWAPGPFPIRLTNDIVSTGAPRSSLDVTIRYPATGGPYPLFVWMHGLDAQPTYYESYLDAWAAAGYVVAAPTFPGTSGVGSKAIFDDYVFQPAQVRAVIDRLLEDTRAPSSVLDGLIAPDLIAVGGHSLGAITAEGLTEESCCVDARIVSAIRISYGDEPFPNSTWLDRPLPQLFIHGDEDETFPVSASIAAYHAARAPRFLVVLHGYGHTPFRTSAASRILTTTTDFLDFTLKNRASALIALERSSTASSPSG
jgi:dipeptidyl aminopeptidase/acylaminoacyl peptidase